MKPLNILVFPCGSEVALEIHRSLRYSIHVMLFGANSVADHGLFVFENYIEGLPFITDNNFISELRIIVDKFAIDAIYPATDATITILKEHESELNCKIIASNIATTQICMSKEMTYNTLQNTIATPKVYSNTNEISQYPVFMKPKIGYGSRGAKKINSKEEIKAQLNEYPDSITLEYLPGEEYTIDCFTNSDRQLLFAGARLRGRVNNGISVNTIPIKDKRFEIIAQKINNSIHFRGAWFFQVKEDANKKLVLLEIASRLGGSSALYRNKGVNFALLSIFDAFGYKLGIVENDYPIELDRALSNQYKIAINYEEVYVDFDDCLIINKKVNKELISFVYQCINNGKKVILITKHIGNIHQSLKKYRMDNLFDRVIHLDRQDNKYKYISSQSAIFIDDSFSERKDVCNQLNVPVFSPDMIESLLEN